MKRKNIQALKNKITRTENPVSGLFSLYTDRELRNWKIKQKKIFRLNHGEITGWKNLKRG